MSTNYCRICSTSCDLTNGFKCNICGDKFCSIKCFLYQPECDQLITDVDEYWFGKTIPETIDENKFQCCKSVICGLCLMKLICSEFEEEDEKEDEKEDSKPKTSIARCQLCYDLYHISCKNSDNEFANCGCLMCVTYGDPTNRFICSKCHSKYKMEIHPKDVCCCSYCIEDRSCECDCSKLHSFKYFDQEDPHCISCIIVNEFKRTGYHGPEISDPVLEFMNDTENFKEYCNRMDPEYFNQMEELNEMNPEESFYCQSLVNKIDLEDKIHDYYNEYSSDYIKNRKRLMEYIEEVHNHSDTLALLYKHIQNNASSKCNCKYCKYFVQSAPDIDNESKLDNDLEIRVLLMNSSLI